MRRLRNSSPRPWRGAAQAPGAGGRCPRPPPHRPPRLGPSPEGEARGKRSGRMSVAGSDGRKEGTMDGWMDGWVDGRKEGRRGEAGRERSGGSGKRRAVLRLPRAAAPQEPVTCCNGA
ncbi:unnamed protein product [Coccothraustes coccothraustes]